MSEKNTKDAAAQARSAYVAALEDELEGVERQGKSERAKAIKSEIARAKKSPAGRSSSNDEKTA